MSFDSCAICHIIPSSVLRKLALHPDLANERDALLLSAEAAAFARGERTVSRFAALAAVLIPTTSPAEETSGPPELPGFSAASV